MGRGCCGHDSSSNVSKSFIHISQHIIYIYISRYIIYTVLRSFVNIAWYIIFLHIPPQLVRTRPALSANHSWHAVSDGSWPSPAIPAGAGCKRPENEKKKFLFCNFNPFLPTVPTFAVRETDVWAAIFSYLINWMLIMFI